MSRLQSSSVFDVDRRKRPSELAKMAVPIEIKRLCARHKSSDSKPSEWVGQPQQTSHTSHLNLYHSSGAWESGAAGISLHLM